MYAFCPHPGSGRGAALDGCPLGRPGVVLRLAMWYHEALCSGCGLCARAVWVDGLSGWRGGLAWVVRLRLGMGGHGWCHAWDGAGVLVGG